jgi:hypothetical protein
MTSLTNTTNTSFFTDFNLDSKSYNLTELENLLGLETPYTIEILEQKKNSLRDKILGMPSLGQKQKNILLFLDNVVSRLDTNMRSSNVIPRSASQIGIQDKHNSEKKYITRLINIDSLFRNDYYNTRSSDFTFMLPDKVNKVIRMSISNILLPLTCYSVSADLKNNQFKISYAGEEFTCVLPDGNYSTQFKDKAASIETTINRLIQNSGVPNISTNVLFSVDKISGRSIFTCDNSGELTLDFAMDDTSNPLCFKLGWLLGFRSGKLSGPAIVSEGICHISGNKYIFLGINDYQNSGSNNFIANFNESTLPSNIITRLNIDHGKEENGVYSSSMETDLNKNIYCNAREYLGPVDIQKLTFTLYDQFGRIIDLNYMDWSIVLNLTCMSA